MNTGHPVVIRSAELSDLNSLNAIIKSCVMGWNLPDRVKRLSLSSYQYYPHDLQQLELLLATVSDNDIAGVAALESAVFADLPKDKEGMLLHGLYVAPQYQRQGIGSQLLNAALDVTRSRKMDGLLVKAQAEAVDFFQSNGFDHLPVIDANRDYPNRLWKPV